MSGQDFEAYQKEHLFSKFLPEADRVHPPTETYLTGYLEGQPNSVFLSTTGGAGIVLTAMEWLALYQYDCILFDSFFHFYHNDKEREMTLVNRVFEQAKVGCEVVFCLSATPAVKQAIEQFKESIPGIEERQNVGFDYLFVQKSGSPGSRSPYKLVVLKKVSGH